jgi:hypothetical protein
MVQNGWTKIKWQPVNRVCLGYSTGERLSRNAQSPNFRDLRGMRFKANCKPLSPSANVRPSFVSYGPGRLRSYWACVDRHWCGKPRNAPKATSSTRILMARLAVNG